VSAPTVADDGKRGDPGYAGTEPPQRTRTLLAWNDRRILVAVLHRASARQEAECLSRLQAELGQPEGDAHWQAFNGTPTVEVRQ
jgi:hypothetical protein